MNIHNIRNGLKGYYRLFFRPVINARKIYDLFFFVHEKTESIQLLRVEGSFQFSGTHNIFLHKPDKKKEETVPADQSPKKRGRKPKAEWEKWLKEQQELKENRPIFEKKIEAQLPYDFASLEQQIPQSPQWGIEGKNVFWYGF